MQQHDAEMLNAALDAYGVAYIPEYVAAPFPAKGRLMRVLEDWCALIPVIISMIRRDANPRRLSRLWWRLFVTVSRPPMQS